jgi:hypothetical protein
MRARVKKGCHTMSLNQEFPQPRFGRPNLVQFQSLTIRLHLGIDIFQSPTVGLYFWHLFFWTLQPQYPALAAQSRQLNIPSLRHNSLGTISIDWRTFHLSPHPTTFLVSVPRYLACEYRYYNWPCTAC